MAEPSSIATAVARRFAKPASIFEKVKHPQIKISIVTNVTDPSLRIKYLSGSEEDSYRAPWGAWGQDHIRRSYLNKHVKGIERLISERWPKLKFRAETEKNPEKLIAILEEIDDLLFNLEMRIASQNEMRSRGNAESQSDCHESISDVPPGDSESGSQ
jgi:hypothetical protein